jgi:predicted translation initiation factor SUI1
MAKLSSLEDLQVLLSAEDLNAAKANLATPTHYGYDGKPQRLSVKAERRKAGKIVTVITGFQARPEELARLLQALKKRVGAGGSLLDNALELQGDHSAKVAAYLKEQGYVVR